jgi:hypothetical protein
MHWLQWLQRLDLVGGLLWVAQHQDADTVQAHVLITVKVHV